MNPTTTVSGVHLDLDSQALSSQLGLADSIVDATALGESIARCAKNNVVLPTFAQLADPASIPADVARGVDKNAPDARNLFRVHWFNNLNGDRVSVPDHIVLPSSLTGVASPIVVMFGDRFPMITAHKVLAAYSCLVPRVITGQFNPSTQRAVWPSTGNYARGGVAISRITGARGVAVLPAGMSQERFDWLDKWVSDPSDIIRTPGTESNVKEIYDACNEMQRDPKNFIFNQFCEFGNYVGHYEVTGRALAAVYEHVAKSLGNPNLRLAAFTSATGSAGTIGAGDRLKELYGTKIVAVEALECPTMLENGFGEHNIQGIGDKHIPLIHNVMNTDIVTAVSDRATDELDVLFNTEVGRKYLRDRKHIPADVVDALEHFGLSSICNMIAAIKTAKLLDLGPNDVLITIATDGAAMYPSERVKTLARKFNNAFSEVDAAEVFSEHLGHVGTDAMIDCTEQDRNRIFNLGYYTWVEQQGTPLSVFEARRSQSFWRNLRRYVPVWDELTAEFNQRVTSHKK
ncbi:MAG: pyridoxal-phosphate dependent enzyme [Ilumatobacteraceae bacterium]